MAQKPLVQARVTPETKEQIQKVVERGRYFSEADFLRDAIRTKLMEA